MVYAGQELGELAADAEGYSGMDGRTTIFDYWSVPTLRRWHQGKPTAPERQLRTMYRKILNLCNSEKTLAEGEFFDLMYVNQDTLETRRQYAYLRHCDGAMALVVANFGDEAANTSVRIPGHALDCARMASGEYSITELLSGETSTGTLAGDNVIPVQVLAHSARIYRFTRQ